ncbi:hypothetical protein F8388_023481 [Cannabis sativa]|uniref:RRM domain-containing protein n=1 Tax=Cannabis sativa TaxID=3483 RepID=A0A7J6I284_CANSA|nr:hypothetical protein F8388_023481 [Cannabis sativa]KAF4401677.1 hypothetical protein G4B88_000725 [Cannabis sativa]
MPYSRQRRSPSPESPGRGNRRSRSLSLTRSRRSRSRSPEDVVNPGNNLYVTGLSTRVTTDDLEKFFGKEGKVLECHLVTDPRTRESRGFGFVTMETLEDAERCVKHLNRAVLEGRLITVEKVKKRRNGSEEGHQLRAGIKVCEISEVAMVIDILVATHHVDGQTEIPILGIKGEDQDLHMIEGAGNSPHQLVIVDKHMIQARPSQAVT